MAQREPPPSGSAGAAWEHGHDFHVDASAAERGTRAVVWITLATMVVEIVAGWWFNSMALLADGWHMSSHALAIGVSAFAYAAARRLAQDRSFAFGTWKIEVLGGFASALILGMVALLMVSESIEHLVTPHPIQFDQALIVAVIGLLVNVASVWLLGDHHAGHDHDHDHDHDSEMPHSHDLNWRAAYVHVLADAATSLLAIVALLGGKWANWLWLDAATALVGAVVVGVWSINLIRETSRVLLDREMDHALVTSIREAIESDGHSHISDLHLWRVGRAHFACIVGVVTHESRTPHDYRQQLQPHDELVHVTIEVHRRESAAAAPIGDVTSSPPSP